MADTAVSTTKRPMFTRCPTCGRYLTAQDRVAGRYCSEVCAQKYLRCTTCGRHYPEIDAYSPEHCSAICATQFSMRRSYGPARIDIGMEELV